MNQVKAVSSSPPPNNSDNLESDPLNIDSLASTSNDTPMVSITKSSNLETMLDLGTVTDPQAVKTELSLKNLKKEAVESSKSNKPDSDDNLESDSSERPAR